MKENQIIEEHNGVKVIRTSDGYRLFCPKGDYFKESFDEITFDPYRKSFICRKKRDYHSFSLSRMESGNSCFCSYGDENTTECVCDFYSSGKFGCRVNDRVILPPVYDEIDKWLGCDVIYTRKGLDVRYFDLHGNEILKKRRMIPGAKDYLEPYYCGEPQNTDIVQTMDLCEHPEGEDFCTCHGRYAGLSRRTRREHMDWILKQGSDVYKRFRENSLFFWDCYVYSAFMVQSAKDAKHPVRDCLRQMERFGIFEGGWHVTLLILVPQRGFHRRITKEELKSIREMQLRTSDRGHRVPKYRKKQNRTDCGREDFIMIDAVYKGVTNRIQSGAIILATLCFTDHWPSRDEMRKWEKKQKRLQRRKIQRRKK